MIGRYDTDGNSILEGNELRKMRNAQRYDTNSDGKITTEEVLAVIRNQLQNRARR